MNASSTRRRDLMLLVWFSVFSSVLAGAGPPPPPPPPGGGGGGGGVRTATNRYVPPLNVQQKKDSTTLRKLPPPPPRIAKNEKIEKPTGQQQQEKKKVPPVPPSIIERPKQSTTANDALLDRFANKHSSNEKPSEKVGRDPLMERFNRIVGETKSQQEAPESEGKKDYTATEEEKEKPDIERPPVRPQLSSVPSFDSDRSEMILEKPTPPPRADTRNVVDDDEEEMLLLGEAASVPPPLKRMNDLYHAPSTKEETDTEKSTTRVQPRPPPSKPVVTDLPIDPSKSRQQAPPPRQQQQYQPPPNYQQQRPSLLQQQMSPQQQQQRPPQQRQRPPQQQRHPPQQQQQQQQQQYRPPPNYQQQQQQRPPPNRREQQQRPTTKAAPLLKSLWRRVEKGLDSLVNAEDYVADRANQITSQVTHRAKDLSSLLTQSRNPGGDNTPPAIMNTNQRPGQPPGAGQRPGTFGAAKTTTATTATQQVASGPASTQKLPASLASLYSGSFVTPDDSDDSDDEDGAPRRTSPWDDVADKNKAIRAGSSNPDQATRVTPPSAVYGRKDSPFAQLQHQHRQSNNNNPPPNVMPPPGNGQQAPVVQRPFAAARTGPQPQRPAQQAPARPIVEYDVGKPSLAERLGGLMPSMPGMPSVLSKMMGRGSRSYRNMAAATLDVWREDEHNARVHSARRLKRETRRQAAANRRRGQPSENSATPPLTDLLSRCDNGKSTSLLSNRDLRNCRSIAQTRAIMDMGALGLVVWAAHQILSVSEKVSFASIDGAVATLVSNLAAALEGWGYFALVAAFLTAATNFVLFHGQVNGLAKSVSNDVHGASQYAQLYMRLVAGQPVDRHVPERMQQAARAQTQDKIQTIRMQTSVTIVLATMLLMTVSVVQPILLSILAGLYHSLTLPELWSWPIQGAKLWSALMEISHSVVDVIKDLLAEQFSTFTDNPVTLAFQFSIVAALLFTMFIPKLEKHRRVRPLDVNEEVDEDVNTSAFGTVATLSNLGVSSASRLGLLSKSGALEGTLERWRATLPPYSALRDVRSIGSWLRSVGYTSAATLALASPVMVYFHCFQGVCLNKETASGVTGFDSIWNVSIMLFFILRSSWKSIKTTMESSNLRPYVQSFVTGLGEVVSEVSGSKQEGLQTQLGSAISPNIGLSIKDLWAAHTAKRAWAVRGANFDCNNGEVLAILGDDGAGKSRILTAISEVLVNPSKRSLTTTKVRGSVSVGGLDATKWDRDQLKKRLGLFLNDVRTIADNADFMSGFTLEEILEPMDGLLNKNPTAGARAVGQALQISGLSTTLIPRLPGKLSTVVTANENELTPSELRPRCYALSPSEWSKLLLARVLAQTIFDNENVSNAPLVGSLLLLDDLTTHMSEEEELKIMQTLRKTGAATVFTSHKWASGRLADRIVIIKDGAVVESGTHNELLARGPQQSMYAAKWHTMTTG